MVAGPAIVWFRRDLRLRHHPALMAAAADGREVVPVFVVDPAFAAAGAPRRAYLHDSLVALDASIRARGGVGLVLRSGRPVEVIAALADELDAREVHVSRDFAPYGRRRDAAVAAALHSRGRTLRGVGSPYAVDPGTVTKRDGTPYAVFTPFAKAWRQHRWSEPIDPRRLDDIAWTRRAVAVDALGARPDPGCELPPAGEEAALDRWREFLAGGLAGYDRQRNDPALDGTSRLSPALKWGAIHPCQLLADLDARGHGRSSAHGVLQRTGVARVLRRRAVPRAANRLGEPEPADGCDADGQRCRRRSSGSNAGAPAPPASASSTRGCVSSPPPVGCTIGCG